MQELKYSSKYYRISIQVPKWKETMNSYMLQFFQNLIGTFYLPSYLKVKLGFPTWEYNLKNKLYGKINSEDLSYIMQFTGITLRKFFYREWWKRDKYTAKKNSKFYYFEIGELGQFQNHGRNYHKNVINIIKMYWIFIP